MVWVVKKRKRKARKRTWLLPFLHPSVLMVQVELYSPISACVWSRREGGRKKREGREKE